MKPDLRARLALGLLLLSLGGAGAARAEGVPDAQDCYRRSRELGFAQRFDEALAWIDRGLELAPADADLQLWRVRLLGWSGHSRDAIASLDAIVLRRPEVMNDRENVQLARDLRLWEVGDEARSARVRVGIAPTYSTSERGDEFATRTWVMGRIVDTLRIGAATDVRVRDAASDSLASGLVTYDAPTWSIEAEVGGALGGAFLPHLSASIEPSLRLAQPLWAHLRYWRIDFGDAGAHVIEPGLTLTLGDVELDLRWWLGAHDDGSLTNAGLLRARWQFAPGWVAELGAGGGDAADYLDPRRDDAPDDHWIALGGLRWQPSWHHRVFLSYAFRRETTGTGGPATLDRHELSLAYVLDL